MSQHAPSRPCFVTEPPRRPDRGRLPASPDQAESRGASLAKVLVVDDERDLADMAEALLRSQGLEVVVAYSGAEALVLLERHDDIDAMFSDVMMPSMNGLQLADTVIERYPWIKVVLTSGFTVPALLANRDRNYLFVGKPYKIATVMQLLRS